MPEPWEDRLDAGQLAAARRDGQALTRLVGILKVLRGPEGCPWDREQTPASLRPYLLEECHEVLAALDAGDNEGLREELGDLSLHVAFQAELAAAAGLFQLADSLDAISEKLVRRHPHVFPDAMEPVERAGDAREVERLWERVKAREKDASGKQKDSILSGLPASLPGLLRAQRIQEKVAGVGFEWPLVDGALAKLEEELGELRAALAAGDSRALEAEFGDLLFSLVNVARYLKVQPEEALRATNEKFIRRFGEVERLLSEEGGEIASAGLERLDRLWDRVKAMEHARDAGSGGQAN